MSSNQFAVETTNLTKRFGDQTAVNGIDLSVPTGSVFGFLGPNGSGKTTTIRMLLGLADATSGEINLLGHSMPKQLHQALPRVGALVEGPAFYPYLSGRDNLIRLDSASRFAPSKTRKARVDRAIERVGLTHAAEKKVHKYSLGMKQRLGIANALLMPRDLLVLDEPTNGLDPQGTREVRNLIRSLSADGTTILVSSHLLAEIEQLCSHVVVMSAGSIVAQGELSSLRDEADTHIKVLTKDAEKALAELANLELKAVQIESKEGLPQLMSPLSPNLSPPQILKHLVDAGVAIEGYSVDRPSLEERFVALTGEGFDVVQ